MFIFALEHGQGWKVQRRTHKQTERRSCRLILPSPMLLWCSLAAPKLASTYNRAHGTMKEEHDERGGRRKRSRAQFSHITMRVTHANLLLRSSPAHYRTYQRDPKVHQPGWPAGWTSRPRVRRRRATGRVTGGRGAGDADTTDTTAPAACDAPRGRGSAIGTVGADQSRGGGRRRSVIGEEWQ